VAAAGRSKGRRACGWSYQTKAMGTRRAEEDSLIVVQVCGRCNGSSHSRSWGVVRRTSSGCAWKFAQAAWPERSVAVNWIANHSRPELMGVADGCGFPNALDGIRWDQMEERWAWAGEGKRRRSKLCHGWESNLGKLRWLARQRAPAYWPITPRLTFASAAHSPLLPSRYLFAASATLSKHITSFPSDREILICQI
jgi:hypothetical protein